MLYHFLSQLLMPFTLCILIALVAAGRVFRAEPSRRVRRALLLVLLLLAVSTTPAFAYLAAGSLEWRYPPRSVSWSGERAIVVLAGHIAWKDEVRWENELAEDSFRRCMTAVRWYQQTGPCPVVVCGGNVDRIDPGDSTAKVMRDFLLRQGVELIDILLEQRSRNTMENARETAAMLRDRGLQSVAVVTDAIHLRRAEYCFRKNGLDVIPVGCGYRATRWDWSPLILLPSASATKTVQEVAHEWIGLVWYGLRYR